MQLELGPSFTRCSSASLRMTRAEDTFPHLGLKWSTAELLDLREIWRCGLDYYTAALPGARFPLGSHPENCSLIFSLPTMALYASGSGVSVAFPVWIGPLKQATGRIRFPGGWGARVVYRFEALLSTETSLLPWHLTPILPGHAARAFLKVILRAGGVSHDLKHIAFLSTNIKAAIFLCSDLPRKRSDITSPFAPWWCHVMPG